MRGVRWAPVAVALAVYVGLALGVTWPYITHPGTTLTAPLFADVSGSVSKFEALVREGKSPFFTAHLTTIGWPNGVTLQPLLDRVSFLNTLVLWGGSLLIGAIATHSLMMILGFVVTALVMCLLVRRVTGSTAAGFIAGLAYGFWPHMLLIGSAAPTYTWMWMLILPIWTFYVLALNPGFKTAVLAGLSPLPAIFWTPYYALHVSVVALACGLIVLVRLVATGDLKLHLKQLAPAAVLPVFALAGYAAVSALSHSSGIPIRSAGDAFQESAHPLMYVIPGWGSSWGSAPDNLLVRLVPRAAYANLYVGLSVIALAAAAVVNAAVIMWRQRWAALSLPLIVATVMAAAVVALCFLFSLPPHYHVAGVPVPMPDALVIAVQPAFRGGQRFVMPLMGGMAVLAGIGVQLLMARMPSRARPVFIALLAPLVFLDLFASRPNSVEQVPQSTALAALRALPDGPTFEYYPIDQDVASGRIPPTRPCLFVPQHGKTLVDTCELVPQSDQYQRWIHDHTCTSLSEMRIVGVRYVIVDDSLQSLLDCLNGELSGVSTRVADDGKLAVYEFR